MVDWANIGVETGRFTLHEDGQITWQENKTNPLPGDAVASIVKGDHILAPKIALVEGHVLDDAQQKEALSTIESWLTSHLKTILAPLFNLLDNSEIALEGVAKDIGQSLYDNLGVIHRSEIEKFVPELTPELRVGIRKKRIKMGPILVFMPELVKPAAINLRALLSGLWSGETLPMQRPADGRVSITIDPDAVHRNYYRSIGYPIFGNMAIRIDMLDRVITDIYDSSKDFKFQAQHKHMEWLGCGEEDLYAILGSMGFKKQRVETVSPASEATTSDEKPVTEVDEPAKAEDAKAKVELATFFLKKGKISDRPKPKAAPKRDTQQAKKSHTKKPPRANNFSAKPKKNEIDEDSPFAILKQLKK
jgi:ATP-dependent RNA helicase SUPV3L1/SUV3